MTDIITQYAFGISHGFLEAEIFGKEWHDLLRGSSEQSILTKHIPRLVRGMRHIPRSWLPRFKLQIAQVVGFSKDVQASLDAALFDKYSKGITNIHPTIFRESLNSDLPAYELSPKRLLSEGVVVVVAGTLTSAHYLKTTTCYSLANPPIPHRLRIELKTAMSDPNTLPPFTNLNAPPYFSAGSNEGSLLSHGVITRLNRVAPTEYLHILNTDFTIRACMPVSKSSWLVHLNPQLFPEPDVLHPERWLEPGAEHLKKYLVNFTKGSWVCLRKDVARAEIVYTLALLVRRWVGNSGKGMELFQTMRRDSDIERDSFNPFPDLGSTGVRVVLK